MRTGVVIAAMLTLGAILYGAPGFAGPGQSAPPGVTQPPHDHEHGATAAPAEKDGTPGMRHGMMAKKQAADADLHQLVTEMNAATGAAKTAAMATLLTRLVTEHATMRAQMDESMKTMMAQCSMMKASGAGEKKPEH
ncbi:MAG: hypothetical protein ABJA98_02550 [Acidobacteriota bacterium]